MTAPLVTYDKRDVAAMLGVSPARVTDLAKMLGIGRLAGNRMRFVASDLHYAQLALGLPVEKPPTVPIPEAGREIVYVVGYGRYVKIGRTKGLRERIKKMQTSAPEKIAVYAVFDGGADLEKRLHERFADYRLNGEWFSRDLMLFDWIQGGCK
jgi:hypothetical protein